VRELLALPKPPEHGAHDAASHARRKADDAEQNLRRFYAERQPPLRQASLWNIFRVLVGGSEAPRLTDASTSVHHDPEGKPQRNPSAASAIFAERLEPFFAWPDGLAVLYADRYRSAFILAFLLSALAVGMALLPVAWQLEHHHAAETTCMVLELGAILLILAVVFAGRRERWHERWIDYRLAAELVRQLRLVAPLGGGYSLPQIPAQWATYGQPAATWMAWYVRAVERAIGLPTVVVDNAYILRCLSAASHVVTGQIDYHQATARQCHRIEHRLHGAGIVLLTLTLVACALHLLPAFEVALPAWLPPPMLTFLCGFFPAMGAALAGIINQGEFLRIAKRSHSMSEQLQRLHGEVESLREEISQGLIPARQYSQVAVLLAGDAARLLVNEVLDWRIVFLDRPLHPPA